MGMAYRRTDVGVEQRRYYCNSRPQYRLINERVATQNTRTIYFRINVDFDAVASILDWLTHHVADIDELMRRFRRLELALGVERYSSDDFDWQNWQEKQKKYMDYAHQKNSEFGDPGLDLKEEDGKIFIRDWIWNEAEGRWEDAWTESR